MELDYDAMKDKYKVEAKKADRRLRALEDAAKKYHDNKYLEYGYARAMSDLSSYGMGNRFDKKPPEDPKELQKLLADVERFNSSPTATFTQFQELDTKRYSTLIDPDNPKTRDWIPEGLTEAEFLKITQLGVWDLLSEGYNFGYKTALQIAKRLTGNKKYIMNRKKAMTKQAMDKILNTFKFSGDPELAKLVQGVLNSQ